MALMRLAGLPSFRWPPRAAVSAESYANGGHPTATHVGNLIGDAADEVACRSDDSPPAPASAAAGKDEVRSVGDAVGDRGARAVGTALSRARSSASGTTSEQRGPRCRLGGGDGGVVPFRVDAAAPAAETAGGQRAVGVGGGACGGPDPRRFGARRRAGANSHRRGCARGHGDPAFQRRRRACRRGAALDTRGEFAADAVRGDGRDQVAAAGQGHRPVHDGVRSTRRSRGPATSREPAKAGRRPRRNGRGPAGERAGVRPRRPVRASALVRRAPRARRCGRARRCPAQWSVGLPPLGSATMTFEWIRCRGRAADRRRRPGGQLRRGARSRRASKPRSRAVSSMRCCAGRSGSRRCG